MLSLSLSLSHSLLFLPASDILFQYVSLSNWLVYYLLYIESLRGTVTPSICSPFCLRDFFSSRVTSSTNSSLLHPLLSFFLSLPPLLHLSLSLQLFSPSECAPSPPSLGWKNSEPSFLPIDFLCFVLHLFFGKSAKGRGRRKRIFKICAARDGDGRDSGLETLRPACQRRTSS